MYLGIFQNATVVRIQYDTNGNNYTYRNYHKMMLLSIHNTSFYPQLHQVCKMFQDQRTKLIFFLKGTLPVACKTAPAFLG